MLPREVFFVRWFSLLRDAADCDRDSLEHIMNPPYGGDKNLPTAGLLFYRSHARRGKDIKGQATVYVSIMAVMLNFCAYVQRLVSHFSITS